MERFKAACSGALKSFTMYFNVLLGVAITIAPMVQETLPQLQAYLPANTYKWLALLLIVGNILLRIKTNKALSEK